MTKKDLKKKILKKFGTISHFSRLSGRDRYELQKFFARHLDKEEIAEMSAVADSTRFEESDDTVSDEKITQLREAVKASGSIAGFCSDNPDFPIATVKEIIYGYRKKKSPQVRKLFAHFNINIDE
jgi:hypothetical protein